MKGRIRKTGYRFNQSYKRFEERGIINNFVKKYSGVMKIAIRRIV